MLDEAVGKHLGKEENAQDIMKYREAELDCRMTCPYPNSIVNPNPSGLGFLRMYVGCGKCGACLHNRRTDWSFRIKEEAKYSSSCYFTTLTYDNSVVPFTDNLLLNLDKSHVQAFNKKLRRQQEKYTDQKYRFFCVGEYGSKFFRPHYHIIFFNLSPELAKPEKLLPVWEHGLVHLYPLDQGLTHYTTKYHVTAQKITRKLERDLDHRIDEFTIASNKPPEGEIYGGIGYQYIKTTGDFHRKSLTTVVRNNGFAQKMPSYYYRHIFKDLEPEVKEQMRIDGEKRYDELHQKEIKRLSKLGYDYPEQEILLRQVAEARNVIFKAKQKGVF